MGLPADRARHRYPHVWRVPQAAARAVRGGVPELPRDDPLGYGIKNGGEGATKWHSLPPSYPKPGGEESPDLGET